MIYQAILTASLLLLLAFAIEHLGKRTGIPSVVLLIAVGMIGKQALDAAGIQLTGLEVAVPVVGTIGLILIVLEGAFDIELKKGHGWLIGKSLMMAAAGLLLCGAVIALLLVHQLALSPFKAVLIALTVSVISSAVAIPSSQFLREEGREFIVYESSFSDILGILLFFTLLNSDGSLSGIMSSLVQGGLLSLLFGAVCALGLLQALLRTDGHIRFIPLLAGLFALYAGGKLLGLSPLFMVLLFGLVINNLPLLARFRWFANLADDSHAATVNEFKSLTMELTFAVRGFFFILLGYWTDVEMLRNPEAWIMAAVVLVVIFYGRRLLLKLMRASDASALVWIAPRGLITVLLFLSAKEVMELPSSVDGAVLLVVLISALAVTLGRWSYRSTGTN